MQAPLNKVRLELLGVASQLSLDELLRLALDRAEDATGSAIGFFHFVDSDEKSLMLQQWSTRTTASFCEAEGQGLHYNIDEAGVWVDCVRQRAPVVHNDYASLEHRKGLPVGHAAVVRELVVPVLREGRIVAIMGVGNKATDYDADDVEAMVFLADVTWHLVEHKRKDEALVRSEARLRAIFETMPIGWAEHRMVFDSKGNPADYVFIDANSAFETFTGLRREDTIGKRVTELIPGIKEADLDLISLYGQVVLEKTEKQFEFYFEPFERWYKVTAYSREAGHFVAMFEDISERKRAELEMRQLNEDLARSNRDLEQFAYVASHDLQEPLGMISSYMRLLSERYGSELDERADRYMQFALDASTRMQRLVSDLLAFSRAGRSRDRTGPVDLAGLLREVVHDLSRALDRSGGSVDVGPMPTLPGDRTELGQVFLNLISNGLKFHGDEPPKVTITARRAGERWEFKVSDNGIGIGPDAIDRIFDVFSRAHKSSAFKGSGIGLAIVKKVVELHDGEIRVESTVDEGTTFTISLPAR